MAHLLVLHQVGNGFGPLYWPDLSPADAYLFRFTFMAVLCWP